MKKIFTLLFCVAAISFAANANNNSDRIQKCIDVLLGADQSTAIMTTNLDANHDGVIDIADVTALIDMKLQNEQMKKAAAKGELEQGPIKVILDKRATKRATENETDKKEVK
jgi:hypothetical protein